MSHNNDVIENLGEKRARNGDRPSRESQFLIGGKALLECCMQ